MATSTLIQYLNTTGADGVDIGLGVSNRRQVETFISGEAIVAGDIVALDLVTAGLTAGQIATQVIQASTAVDRKAVAGVALSAATGAGEPVQVCIAGVCSANVLAMAQGDVLTVTATAGSMDTITAATAPQVAVALETAAAPGTALVLVNCAGF